MKRYLIPIIIVLVLASGLIVGCGETTTVDETKVERDKAITFYQGAYPIANEIKQVVDEWNLFLQEFSQRKVDSEEILRKSQGYATRLEALPKDLSMLYAPPPLRQLKDDIASSINLAIEGFSLYKELAETKDINYARQGDQKLMECNRLMMRVADEWDDGLAHYKVKPSEILP